MLGCPFIDGYTLLYLDYIHPWCMALVVMVPGGEGQMLRLLYINTGSTAFLSFLLFLCSLSLLSL
jgi:hypothetical protein